MSPSLTFTGKTKPSFTTMVEFWLINVFNRDSAATLEDRELKAI